MLGKWFDGIILKAGTAIVGKVRLVDSGGTEVTEATGHSVQAKLIAGTAIAGKVGIDQTTPGTTDRVTANVDKIGGTSLTGRDISLDLKALTDDTIKGLLKSIGDIAATENLVARLGLTTDAIVDAGVAGSVSAKLRRATQGLEDLKSLIVLAAGTNVIGAVKTLPEYLEIIYTPFGKGLLTTDGQQYSAEVVTTDDDYKVIEAVTITHPVGYVVNEIIGGLVAAGKSSGATETVVGLWEASDAGASWQALCAEITRAADASAYADYFTAAGVFALAGNYLGQGASSQFRFKLKSGSAAGETATGKVKASSKLTIRFKRS